MAMPSCPCPVAHSYRQQELIGACGYGNHRIFRPENLVHFKPGESFVGPEHGIRNSQPRR